VKRDHGASFDRLVRQARELRGDDATASEAACHRALWSSFEQPSPAGGRAQRATRLVFLGDGPDGDPLEVMAVELSGQELLVIHAMPLRERYRDHYEEARKWRS